MYSRGETQVKKAQKEKEAASNAIQKVKKEDEAEVKRVEKEYQMR
jgi:hypothetical protein